jgi:hypothetical protein
VIKKKRDLSSLCKDRIKNYRDKRKDFLGIFNEDNTKQNLESMSFFESRRNK